jgi:nucleoside phosphorylase
MTEPSLADIVVLVIREDEQKAVLSRLPNRWYLPCENRTYVIGDSQSSVEDSVYRVAVLASLEQGPGYAQEAAEDAIADLRPQWLALVGIAGAVPDAEFALGDVVVASRVHDYSVSAAIEDSGGRRTEEFSNQGGPMAEKVRDLAKLVKPLSGDARGWNHPDSIGVPRPPVDLSPSSFYGSDLWRSKTKEIIAAQFDGSARDVPEVTSRSIASSGRLVKDTETLEKFIDGSRELRAVEMELGGVYKAARRREHEYPILAVRGISDIVGFKRDPGWTAYACHTAAAFFFALLRVMPGGFIAGRRAPARMASQRQSRFQLRKEVTETTPRVPEGTHSIELGSSANAPRDPEHEIRVVRPTLIRAAYVIGGVTGETTYPAFEDSELGHVCTKLGDTIARSGAELVVCSPFPDSADHHCVRGYVQSGLGGRIQFHSPRHESVVSKRRELESMLGTHNTRFVDYFYPSPEDEKSWAQAWLLCQLQALEYADVVIAVGGRVSHTAMTLLHLAEARRLPIVPFAFLGGAAKRFYERRDWQRLHPGLHSEALREKQRIGQAMIIADRLVADRISGFYRDHDAPKRFFLSRAIPDRAYADELATYLKGLGLTPLVGDTTIRDERMVQSTIEEAILQSDVCVVFWSQAYAVSRWCSDELDLALERARVSELQIWIFNLDGSDIVPRSARHLPQVVVRSAKELMQACATLLQSAS